MSLITMAVLGVSFIIITLLLSIVLAVFYEFPLTRLLQYLVLKPLSHDDLLFKWHVQVCTRYQLGLHNQRLDFVQETRSPNKSANS